MADADAGDDTETGKDQPSLELPSLGWRRKRRSKPARSQPAEPPAPAAAEETRPLFAAETEPPAPADPPPAPAPAATPAPTPPHAAESTPEASPAPPTRVVEPVAEEPVAGTVTQEAVEPVAATEPTEPAEPAERAPGGMVAAVLTGIVVGLGIVGLTWASLRLCEQVQGTSSCGNSGYGLLLAILAAMVVVGGLLLRAAHVPQPGSTSFLAVGLTSVLALVFLVDSLMDRPMVVVLPALCAGTFAAAHWVTRTFVEPAER